MLNTQGDNVKDDPATPSHGPIRLGLVVTVALLLLGGAALEWWGVPVAPAFGLGGTVEGTAALIRSWGAWGVLGSIGLMVAHSFLPFPAEIVALANGMCYGPLWGAVITWVGAMLGASAAFCLVRRLGRPYVERLVPLHHWQRLAVWSRERGGIALLVSRLIPIIAFNLINYVAALTEMPWWTFLWATGLGILPLTILLAVVGNRMLSAPLWTWLLLGAAAVLVWFVLDHWRSASQRRNSSAGGQESPSP